MSGVRPAEARDDLAVTALLRAMHRESIQRTVPIHPKRLAAFIQHIREDPDHASLVYVSASGVIDGLYIGHVSPYAYSEQLGAWDMYFYVRPERRGSMTAYRLWQAFRAWAKARGAKAIHPGVSTGINPERSARFYRGMGLEQVGTVFFGEL